VPVIRITTNTSREARDRVAAAITRELMSLGMIESHIATLFQGATTDDLYEGSLTLSRTAGPVGFALVQVGMTDARPDSVRDSLARSITTAFGPDVDPHRVSVDFVAREPYDVYVGGQAMGRRPVRADPAAAGAAPVVPMPRVEVVDPQPAVDAPAGDGPISETELREALFAVGWKPEILEVPSDTLLEAVRPAWMTTWDSLAAIGVAESLESEFGLAERTFERGQVEFRVAFGDTARITDLAAYVARRTEAA
jgi:hypothetical protein